MELYVNQFPFRKKTYFRLHLSPRQLRVAPFYISDMFHLLCVFAFIHVRCMCVSLICRNVNSSADFTFVHFTNLVNIHGRHSKWAHPSFTLNRFAFSFAISVWNCWFVFVQGKARSAMTPFFIGRTQFCTTNLGILYRNRRSIKYIYAWLYHDSLIITLISIKIPL